MTTARRHSRVKGERRQVAETTTLTAPDSCNARHEAVKIHSMCQVMTWIHAPRRLTRIGLVPGPSSLKFSAHETRQGEECAWSLACRREATSRNANARNSEKIPYLRGHGLVDWPPPEEN
jgi:hypothetical protein